MSSSVTASSEMHGTDIFADCTVNINLARYGDSSCCKSCSLHSRERQPNCVWNRGPALVGEYNVLLCLPLCSSSPVKKRNLIAVQALGRMPGILLPCRQAPLPFRQRPSGILASLCMRIECSITGQAPSSLRSQYRDCKCVLYRSVTSKEVLRTRTE